jgi:phosphatidate cytidylyltransferase
MSNLIARTITGILFIAVIVCSLLWSPIPFSILFLVFTLTALYEFYGMVLGKANMYLFISGMIAGTALYVSIALYALKIIPAEWLYFNFILLNLVFLIELLVDGSSAVRNTSYAVLGVIYVVLPFALLNLFYNLEGDSLTFNPNFLLGYFILTWTYDTLAYICGKLFGRTKLFPAVSPQKTWEGAIAGGLFTLAAAYLIFYYFGELGLGHWLVVASLVIVLGTFGDLIESMFKRNFNVKDIGKALPGHGGVLDRFDGLLFSAPAVLFYFYLIR